MRKLIKAALIAAVTVPVLFASAGAASADAAYGQETIAATPHGAWLSGTFAQTRDGWGHDNWGHDGWDHDGWDHDGWGSRHEYDASYRNTTEYAGPDGAALTATGAAGWGRDYYRDSDHGTDGYGTW